MKKGTIVYLDGIKCHMGEIDHSVFIEGEEYYILSASLIDGVFEENIFSDEEAKEEGFYVPADCCGVASKEDTVIFNAYRQ